MAKKEVFVIEDKLAIKFYLDSLLLTHLHGGTWADLFKTENIKRIRSLAKVANYRHAQRMLKVYPNIDVGRVHMLDSIQIAKPASLLECLRLRKKLMNETWLYVGTLRKGDENESI